MQSREDRLKKKAEAKKEYKIKYPWVDCYYNARLRCNNPANKDYCYYGGRGIKFLMTIEDLKTIWLRDKAHLMKKPSIDRINNDGNYHLNNCRFIELRKNSAHPGESHHHSKLSNEQVLEMRKNYKFRVNTHRMLAKIYGISHHTVRNIVNRKTWRHI